MSPGYGIRENVNKFLEQSGRIVFRGDPLITRSKHGNAHIYRKLSKNEPEYVRIALQAVLGSDPTREAIAILQCHAGIPAAVALFETKAEAAKVTAWRLKHEQMLSMSRY